MHTRSIVALSLALTALLAGCAAATDEAAPEGVGDEATGERGEAITLAADMVWAGSANATLSLVPGTDAKSVADPAPNSHEVYQVLVDPQPNTQNGTIEVYRYWPNVSQNTCINRFLSVRTLWTSGLAIFWPELEAVDVVSQPYNTGGEFPESGCRASVSIPFASNVTQVRVMAQARYTVSFNGNVLTSYYGATVSASGKSPAPDLNATMKINADGAANAVVVNDGPVTATSVDADIKYEYKYCPPALPGEGIYCTLPSLDTGECIGSYCGPGTWGSAVGQRPPITCSWTKDFPQVTIGANGGVLNWVWHQAGTQARCGLCQPNDNRCADPSAKVTARSLTAPYSLMPASVAYGSKSGVL